MYVTKSFMMRETPLHPQVMGEGVDSLVIYE